MIGHLGLLAVFVFAPAPSARPAPAVVTVDLLASLPGPPAAVPRPAPAPAAKSTPAPAPPKAAPKPLPPVPKKVVLPDKAPPTPVKPAPKPRPRERPEELDYDDALDRLRDEMGEATPSPDQSPAAEPTIPAPVSDAPAGGSASGRVDPEEAAWRRDVERHVKGGYVMPPEFSGRRLATQVCVLVAADGSLMGAPGVERASGDPFFDDNAVRATERANPLPAPPGGSRELCFRFAGDE